MGSFKLLGTFHAVNWSRNTFEARPALLSADSRFSAAGIESQSFGLPL